MHKPHFITLGAALMLAAPTATSAFDDTSDLAGKKIVFAGQVEQVRCPVFGKYDCLTWPRDFLKFSYEPNVCFVASMTACSLGCSGMIAIGAGTTPYFYEVESGGSIRKHAATMVECPSAF
jgi:hypothetical protein